MVADVDADELIDAFLSASRALVGLAAHSLAGLDTDVTLPQYRALVVLASRGPRMIREIAEELGVNPSTGTRMCDRLVRKGLIRRSRTPQDRRAVRLTLTAAGRHLIDEVTRRRREELTALVHESTPQRWHRPLAEALREFAVRAGEPPEQEWWLGWPSPRLSEDDE